MVTVSDCHGRVTVTARGRPPRQPRLTGSRGHRLGCKRSKRQQNDTCLSSKTKVVTSQSNVLTEVSKECSHICKVCTFVSFFSQKECSWNICAL